MQRQLIDLILGLFPLKALFPREAGGWGGGCGGSASLVMVEIWLRISILTWRATRLKRSSYGFKISLLFIQWNSFPGTILVVTAQCAN